MNGGYRRLVLQHKGIKEDVRFLEIGERGWLWSVCRGEAVVFGFDFDGVPPADGLRQEAAGRGGNCHAPFAEWKGDRGWKISKGGSGSAFYPWWGEEGGGEGVVWGAKWRRRRGRGPAW
jgi:hypothetical protein